MSSRDLTRDQVDELLGAWAVDALDDADRVAVEAALARHPELADTARDLREAAAGLGAANARRGNGVAAVLEAARAARTPGIDVRLAAIGPSTTVEAYADQVGALTRVLDRVPDDGWDRTVDPYAPWTVRDLVAHLVEIERYSASFLGFEPHDVSPELEGDHLAMTETAIARSRALPVDEVVAEWRRLAERTAAHALALDHEGLERAMPLHGIPFRVTTAIVARAFELWTHADDIRAAIGEPLDVPPPPVLHRMAHESVNSLPLAACGLAEPPGPAVAHVVLTGHGGGSWTLLVGGTTDRDAEPDVTLVADIVDYCRVVSRRLSVDDLQRTVDGDATLATKLLTASQFIAV